MTLRILSLLTAFTLAPIAYGSTCSKSLDGLEQIIHLSKDKRSFPQRLDNRLLGRFKASKGFYVFESQRQMILGLDLGIIGKKTYPVQACLSAPGWLQIRALYEGEIQTVLVRTTTFGGKAALELKDGTGPLKKFKGVYPRQNMDLSDIARFFNK